MIFGFVKRFTGALVAAIALAAASETLAQDELKRIELKYKVEAEKLQKPLDVLRAGYKRRLAALEKELGATGDLNGVLAAREAGKKGDPEPDKLANSPKVAETQELFLREKQKRLEARNKARIAMKKNQLAELTTLGTKLTKTNQLEDAKTVNNRIQALKKEIESFEPEVIPEIAFKSLKMNGRFYVCVNASANFYVNGKRVLPAKRGKSKSELINLKIGDSVVFSVHNGDGGRKWFKTAFISSDGKHVISFNTKNLKVIPDGDKRRSITSLEYDRLKVFANARDVTAVTADFPFKHRSEWVWEHGGNALLCTIITPEMIEHGPGKPPSR